MKYKIKAEVWLYPGMADSTVHSTGRSSDSDESSDSEEVSDSMSSRQAGAWHFVMLPKKQSEEIKKRFGAIKRGWGSLPVLVTILRPRSGQIGKTSWKTSIFPDKKAGAYLLPLKSDVRKKENIMNGDTITFLVEIRT